MLNTLFGFIWLGCGERADINGRTAVAAVAVINELVYKKCFTQRDTQACLVAIFEVLLEFLYVSNILTRSLVEVISCNRGHDSLFQNTFRVLQLVTQGSAVQQPRLHEIDPLLVTKLGELLHILIENHLSRFPDDTPDAALLQFVHLVQVRPLLEERK